MFVKPDNWKDLSSEEKLALRLDHFVSTDNIDFISAEARDAYKERVTIIREAVEMKKVPYRVPVNPMIGEYALRYYGLTPYDQMYNQEEALDAHIATALPVREADDPAEVEGEDEPVDQAHETLLSSRRVRT